MGSAVAGSAVAVGALSVAGSVLSNSAANSATREANEKLEKQIAKRLAEGNQKIDENEIYNQMAIDKQAAADEFAINRAVAIGSGAADTYIAGSGLAGGITDDIDRQVELDALADKQEAQRGSRQSAESVQKQAKDSREGLQDWAEEAALGKQSERSVFSLGDAVSAVGAGYSAHLSAKPRT